MVNSWLTFLRPARPRSDARVQVLDNDDAALRARRRPRARHEAATRPVRLPPRPCPRPFSLINHLTGAVGGYAWYRRSYSVSYTAAIV